MELTHELKKEFQTYNKDQLNNDFIAACSNGHLDIIKYLLTSPELKENADIHAEEDGGFIWACDQEYWEVIEYLLSFDNELCIDFDNMFFNVEWAIENQWDTLIVSMMKNLKRNNIFKYIERLPLIESYNATMYEEIKNFEIQKSDINSIETPLFV